MPQFEDFQLESIDGRQFITRRESAKGIPDAGALAIRRADMNTDGNGFDPTQRFTEHLPDGFDAPVAIALVDDEGVFGGNFMPRYSEIELDMPAICGASGLVSTTTLADTRIKEVWKFPNGLRDIETLHAWFGQDSRFWELFYGKIMTWVIESERTGETGGNKSYHFNAALRNQAGSVSVAQNAILNISAADASGDGVFSVQKEGSVAESVTVHIGDSTSTVKAAFEALNAIAGVTVVGTVAAASGELHILTASSATGNATIYSTITVTPGMSNSALQTAIRALSGNFANVTVTGSTTTPGTTYTISGAPDTSYNGVYSLTTDVFGGELDDNGNSDPVPTYKNSNSRYLCENGAGQGWKLMTSTQFANAVSSGAFTYRRGSAGTPDTPTIDDWVDSSVEDVAIHVVENTVGGSGSYNIQFPSGVGDVANISASPGTGWTGTSTPPGGAGGSIAITVTSPANTPITITKTSGTGWSASITQAGSDGSGPSELAGGFIEPTHWLVLKAADKAELDAIDMGDADTPIDPDLPNIVQTATGHSFSMENLVQAVYVEDGKVNPGSHITRRPNITASLTVAVQQEGDTDYAEDIYATENFGGCGVEPFWLRFRARCELREFWIDLYCSRNQQAAHPAQEGLAQWQFPLIRRHNAAGSLFFTLIKPAS